MAGKFGAATFYSFASTKYWPAGGGGLAVVHDRHLADRFASIVASLERPTVVQEFRNLALQTAKAAVFKRSLYGFVGRPMRRWVEKWALLEPQLDMRTILGSQAAVAGRQALQMPQRVEQQRANSLRLLNQLGTLQDVILPEESPGTRYNYHLFPVLLKNGEERQAMIASLWENFVDTSTLYSNSIAESRLFGYRDGCPVAESVADRIITLPNYASLRTCDIDYVAYAFVSSLRAYRNASPRCHSCRLLPTVNVPSNRSVVQKTQ
jgi:dTDP-4-amino-4,6-dideoxygalactose transaminase